MKMELFAMPLAAYTLFLVLLILIIIKKLVQTRLFRVNLPPGSLGWPLIGETLSFFASLSEGKPEKFITERMKKYDSKVFKTSLTGEPFVVFCESAGNKFLFSNENKLVNVCWPKSVKKLLRSSLNNLVGEEAKRIRKLLFTYLGPDALKGYTERIDIITQQHINTHWQGKEKVDVYQTVKLFTFGLACDLFASINDPTTTSKLGTQFDVLVKGVIGFSINIPGTRFYHSMKAATAIREELKLIIRQRKEELKQKSESPAKDLLSYLLVTPDTSGRFLSEMEIIDNILLLLFAGHDTSRSVLTSLIKYLGEMPQVYAKVLQEQLDIANSKEAEELLKWADVQKMKYTASVVSEAMRLSPPASGIFREALADFTYEGFTIPKGWKLYSSICSAHKDASHFQNPEDFDVSRFEGEGPAPYSYIPFGGGPRMCLGYEFARVEILVFLHNIIKRFKWYLLNPNEKFGYDPMMAPSQGLAIHLQPHQCQV